ncbi:MAG: chromosomal replication initiator protein DnaA [Candidatus Omnitrophota bacterium]
MQNEKIWQVVLGEMEALLPKTQFMTWFRGTNLELVGDRAIVICPNLFSRDWLKSKHDHQILESIQKLAPEIKEVKYKIKSSAGAERLPLEIKPSEGPKNELHSPAREKINLNDNYSFDKFVVSSNNALAFAVAKEVADSPGQKHNPLFIYGGVGLGKTHLAQAIGHQVQLKTPDKKIVYVSCETFTNDFINAIASRKMNQFKKNYREVDVLIVDDIQFLSAKEGSQEEFFHTFNSLHQSSRQIILTADKPPQAIPALEGRLQSRFGGGMVVDVQPPNYETRIAILSEKCREKGFVLTDEVINYLAKNIHSNIRELEGALNRLMVYCQFNGASPSLDLASTVLKDTISSANKKIDTAEIVSSVCKYFSVTHEEIISGRRKKELVLPRQIAIYLIREQTTKSLPEIGKIMGGKDHTTIMHAEKKISELLKIDKYVKESVENIRQSLLSIS